MPTTAGFRPVYAALLISSCVSALDGTVVAVALNTISANIGGAEIASWVGASYLLTAACLSPVWAKVADVFGRKVAVLAALAGFLLSSIACGASTTMPQLIAARAIQGVAGGGISYINRVILADITTLQERGMYQGGLSAVWGIATSLGGILGGSILELVSWQAVFYLNVPIVAVTFLLHANYLSLPRKGETITFGEHMAQFDSAGLVLIVGGSASLLFGLSKAALRATQASSVIYLLVGTIGLLAGAYNEVYTSKTPILPPRVFKSRNSASTLTICGIHSCVFMLGSFYLPQYFQALGNTPMQAGICTLPFAISSCTSIVTAVSAGFVLTRWPRYRDFMLYVFLAVTVGFAGLCLLGDSTPKFMQEALLVLPALGVGPGWTLTLLCYQASISADYLTSAMAGFSLIRAMTAAAGVTVGAVIYTSRLAARLERINAEDLDSLLSMPLSAIKNLEPASYRQSIMHAHATALRGVWVAGALLSVSALLLTFLVSKDLGREKQQAKANVAFAEDTATEELQPLTLNDEVDDFLEENAAK